MYNIFHFSLYLIKINSRDFYTIFNLIVLPFLFFIFQFDRGTGNPQDTLLLISIPMIILSSVLFNFGSCITSYKEHQFFIKYKLLGLKPLDVTLSVFAFTLMIQIFSIVFTLIMATLFFNVVIDLSFLYVLTLIFLGINLLEFSIVFLLVSLPIKSNHYGPFAQILYFYQLFVGLFLIDLILENPILTYAFNLFNPLTIILKIIAFVRIDDKSLLDFPLELISLMTIIFCLIYLGNKYFKWESVRR